MLISVHESAARDIASRFVCSDTAAPLDACSCGRNHIRDATLRARRDPSKTLDLRQRFMKVLDKRWRSVTKMVTEAVATSDMFGLRSTSALKLQIVSMSSGQVPAFQKWVDGTLNELILGFDRDQWIGEFSRSAYLRGWNSAKSQVGRDLPLNMDRADIITHLTISELQGVMEAFSQRAVRAFSDGLMHHLPPAKIARVLRKAVASIGVVRSRATVQAMMVRAAAEASLDYYEMAGINQVGVLPETIPSPARSFRLRDAKRKPKTTGLVEVLTAGDDDVCIVCQDIAENNPYTIAEARGLIPAHPWCRCAFVPLGDARFAHGDNATLEDQADEIEVAFAYRSIRARDGFRAGQVFRDPNEARLAFDVGQLDAGEGEQVWEVDITGIEGVTADSSAIYLPAGTSFEVIGYDELAKVWMVCATASQ
jgi:hypothetical protein